MNQLELHKKIEEFFKAGVKSADIKIAQSLISKNDDAKKFFFSQADDFWLDWFLQNGLLDEIKKKAKDPTSYSHRTPELRYLSRMAEKKPVEVAKIIDSIKISEANFNPETIDRFLWITSILPTEQVKMLTAKILNEKWIYLMRDFRKTGYEFETIVKKLAEKKENNAILEFAQALLVVRSKTDAPKKGDSFDQDKPFYVNDLNASGIFATLADIDESHVEQALKVLTSIMAEIIKLSEPDNTKVFNYVDPFSLLNIDFFTVKIENKEGISHRKDIKNLGAAITKLVERTIGKKCKDINETKRLFKYIDGLPSCRSMWRLRLFALIQCPNALKEELKKAFFRVFDVGERYFEIENGTEYHQALIRCFGVLDIKTQRKYVQEIFRYFDADLKDKDKKKWRKRDGIKILYFIKKYLTLDERKEIKDKFGISLDEYKYKPEPEIGKMYCGTVQHRSHVNLTEYTIDQIVENLKSEWTPEKLKEQFKDDDFLTPRGVEGLGDALKEDVKERTDDYLENINSFFDRDNIHPYYLYFILRGFEEMLRNKYPIDLVQVGQILGLFETIKDSGKKESFERNDKVRLIDWIGVHKVIVDILLYVLENKDKRDKIHKAYREQVKNLIFYLFTVQDPLKEHEKPEYGDLYHIAINSVRGRAFEVFVVFTDNDGTTLAEDIKKAYKKILNDDSLAVRFIIGRYLATFYFRDKKFIKSLFPEIFPKDDPDKKDIYLATWEGFLSNTLYDKLFVALKNYYSHAITLDPKNYTERKYSKDLDESLAIHIALAFVHFDLKIDDSLFVQFWDTANITRHKEFISFIGRSCLTRDRAGDEWLKENKVSKEKLIEFWNWTIKNVSEPETLSGFGFWVNPDTEVLDDNIVIEKIAQTLKKSDGNIDWDYGLLKRMPIFAKKNGEETLKVILNFLLDSKNNLNQKTHTPFLSQQEIKEAMKIIYENGNKKLKQKITDLINILIEKGSSIFWELKEILKN